MISNLCGGRRIERPYPILHLYHVFEDYQELLGQLPDPAHYVPNNHGRHCGPSRSSLSLVPRRLDPLPQKQREYWYAMRDCLHSRVLAAMFEWMLDAPGPLHPFATLVRDTGGHYIDVHPDWDTKVVTAQFYLPADRSQDEHGTEIYDEQKRFVYRLPFLPNTGYAFKRTDTSYHAVRKLPDIVRNTLMLTYTREPWDEY